MSANRWSQRLLSHRFSRQSQGLLAINLAAVIFGTAALYGKLDVAPAWIVAMRAAFAIIALALAGGFSTRLLQLPPRAWAVLAASGALLAAHWLTFFISVQLSGIAVATLTFATFPLFTVIVEAASQRRMPRPAELLAGVAIIAAVALLLDPGDNNSNLTGLICGLASAVSYALFWRASQRLDQPLSPATISLSQNCIVLLLLLPALWFVTPAPVSPVQWLALAGLGIFNTAIMLLLYLYALKRVSASTCSGFVALEPVYAIAFAAWLFDEPITPWILLSIVLIIGASLSLLKTGQQLSGQ